MNTGTAIKNCARAFKKRNRLMKKWPMVYGISEEKKKKNKPKSKY